MDENLLIEINDDEYDGEYIWTGENTKTKEDLNHEIR